MFFYYILLSGAIVSVINGKPQNFFINNYHNGYQPAGWKPSGQPFNLPARQEVVPQTVYGPPPSPTTEETEENTSTTTELPTTTEEVQSENLSEKLKDGETGFYYIYHPTGLLQKITYATKDNAEDMAFYAKIKYEDVEPIRAPIFTYDPKTSEVKRIARETQTA